MRTIHPHWLYMAVIHTSVAGLSFTCCSIMTKRKKNIKDRIWAGFGVGALHSFTCTVTFMNVSAVCFHSFSEIVTFSYLTGNVYFAFISYFVSPSVNANSKFIDVDGF